MQIGLVQESEVEEFHETVVMETVKISLSSKLL